ncbi:MAG: YicC/YloC family endoribonuclease [Lachnospiraceae bacterium]|nr:YicC/YloC family endoribonuclease [Lachnospiraceae bacterium]
MINSMTGFGRGEAQSEDLKVVVELKAVNHRYCDLNFKIPKKLNYAEPAMRNLLKKRVTRGKIDAFITCENLSEKAENIALNEGVAKGYYQAMCQMSEVLGIKNDVTVMGLSRFPEVISVTEEEMDQEQTWAVVNEAIEKALEKFNEARAIEGDHLAQDLFGKLDEMDTALTAIEERYPQIVSEYRSRLEDKVQELLEDSTLDESRVAAEVVLYADKICVDEETVRLHSHIDSMRAELKKGGAIGRKLDFIAQEMNREANTILSKTNDKATADLAIDLKTVIEKIREQVQNIE